MKIKSPILAPLTSLLPEVPSLLMGAGPVPIPREVAQANTMVINHLGESMNKIVTGLQAMAQYVFQTNSNKIFGISGPSSAAMEMAVTALLWPGRKVLVLNLGTFSARFGDLARGVGADVVEIFPENTLSCFKVSDVHEALKKNHYDVLTIVQGETSCGIQNVELEQIVKLAHSMNVQTIVDAVCTLSTISLPMDEWGIDVVLTGGQKGLSSVAGVSLIAFSEKTFDFICKREAPMPHWCLDPRRAYRFWVMHEYHYTAPVNGIMALYEALRLICHETLEKRYERHLFNSTTLQHCLEIMGLELHAPKECRLNSVVAIKNQAPVNGKELLATITKNFRVELSGAFGLDIIRVGQMGEQCRSENVRRVIEAIGFSYRLLGIKLDVESALNEYDLKVNGIALLKCV
ncbi:MAG TPA: aminotransferase class V-fold PLP-dependent enzyme [Bacteriovoracaceae bacterium]|nr:aminotransferase class V-fold PLP-dependent enzyme [Bacteriovoracaceae bacterium]